MTRELKLALVVGFLLVLLVSVLIADHLSTSRKAQLDTQVAEQPSVAPVPGPQTPLDHQPFVAITQGQGGGVTHQAVPGSVPGTNATPESTPGRVASGLPFPELTPLNGGTSSMPSPFQAQPILNLSESPRPGEFSPAGTSTHHTIPSTGVATGAEPTRKPAEVAMGPEGFVVPLGQNPIVEPTGAQSPVPGLDQSDTLQGGTSASDATGSIGSAFEKPLSTPSSESRLGLPFIDPKPSQPDRWHTVVSGDSAFSIAKRYYGKGEHWKKLAKANGNRIGPDGQLRVGVRIRLPLAEDLGIRSASSDDKGKAKDSLNRDAKPKDKGSLVKPNDTRIARDDKAGSARTYVVRKGDTLSTISQRELGTMKRTSEIMKLNKISDPSSLKIGATLQLPAT